MSIKVYRARFQQHPELYVKVIQLKKNSFVIAGTPYADQATVGYGSFWLYVELENGLLFKRQEVADYASCRSYVDADGPSRIYHRGIQAN